MRIPTYTTPRTCCFHAAYTHAEQLRSIRTVGPETASQNLFRKTLESWLKRQIKTNLLMPVGAFSEVFSQRDGFHIKCWTVYIDEFHISGRPWQPRTPSAIGWPPLMLTLRSWVKVTCHSHWIFFSLPERHMILLTGSALRGMTLLNCQQLIFFLGCPSLV